MRTRAFWLLSLGHASGLLTVGAISVHLFVHVTDEFGVSPATAARLITLLTGMLVVGMLIGGVFGDRVNKRVIIVSAMFGHMTAMLLLAWSASFWLVTIGVAVQGVAWGARGPLTSALRADYFGPRLVRADPGLLLADRDDGDDDRAAGRRHRVRRPGDVHAGIPAAGVDVGARFALLPLRDAPDAARLGVAGGSEASGPRTPRAIVQARIRAFRVALSLRRFGEESRPFAVPLTGAAQAIDPDADASS